MSAASADARTLEAADWARGNAVRLGVVEAFDPERCRVRVRLADAAGADAVRTGWLPWATWAAGHLRVWSPPAQGEQCLLLAPSGDLGQALALPAVFAQSGAFPAPSRNPQHTLLQWDDGSLLRYERDTRRLQIEVRGAAHIHADADLTLHAGAHLRLSAAGSISLQAPAVEIN